MDTDLDHLIAHAKLSERHWLEAARRGGSGRYGPDYCLAGAAVWRKRIAELEAELRGAGHAQ